MWKSKYLINEKLKPLFFNRELTNNILLIGKSLDYLRENCGNQDVFLLINIVGNE